MEKYYEVKNAMSDIKNKEKSEIEKKGSQVIAEKKNAKKIIHQEKRQQEKNKNFICLDFGNSFMD